MSKEIDDLADGILAGLKTYIDSRIQPGPQGDRGEPGPAGDRGAAGSDGKDGKDGKSVDMTVLSEAMAVEVRAAVANAVAAIPQPQEGKDGAPGTPGRDAAEFDILAGIRPDAIYLRGTWARHEGGLFRSFRSTDPIEEKAPDECGWECMVEGIAGLELAYDGERSFTLRAKLSSGKVFDHAGVIPAQIYRGVFRQGEGYKQCDTVTWSGSQWFATKDTDAQPGGGSDDWRLCVKRGRDGNDGVMKQESKSGPVKLK